MRRISVTLVVLLALSASLLPGGPAHAARTVLDDARGDVLGFNIDTGKQWKFKQANGDIVKTKIRHGQDKVVVKLKFRALKRRGDFRADYLRVVTNKGLKREVYTTAGPGNWSGEVAITKPNGDTVNCKVQHRIRYDRNLVKVQIPRWCLGKPHAVRVGAGAIWGKGSNVYIDDGQRKGQVRDQLKLSDPVRR